MAYFQVALIVLVILALCRCPKGLGEENRKNDEKVNILRSCSYSSKCDYLGSVVRVVARHAELVVELLPLEMIDQRKYLN